MLAQTVATSIFSIITYLLRNVEVGIPAVSSLVVSYRRVCCAVYRHMHTPAHICTHAPHDVVESFEVAC